MRAKNKHSKLEGPSAQLTFLEPGDLVMPEIESSHAAADTELVEPAPVLLAVVDSPGAALFPLPDEAARLYRSLEVALKDFGSGEVVTDIRGQLGRALAGFQELEVSKP